MNNFGEIHQRLENLYGTTPRSPKPKLTNEGKDGKIQAPTHIAESHENHYEIIPGHQPPRILDEEDSVTILSPPSNAENPENQDKVVPDQWHIPFKRLFIFLLVPLRMCVLYYMDILSDILQSIGLYMNCHVKYFTVSASIIVSSYMITALYVRFSLGYKWSTSIFFPWRFE